MTPPPGRPAAPERPHAHGLELSPRALIRNICSTIEAAGRTPDRPKIRRMVDSGYRTGLICDPESGDVQVRGDLITVLSKAVAHDPRKHDWRTAS